MNTKKHTQSKTESPKKQLDRKSHQKKTKKTRKKQKQNKLQFPQFFCFSLVFLVGVLVSFCFFLCFH